MDAQIYCHSLAKWLAYAEAVSHSAPSLILALKSINRPNICQSKAIVLLEELISNADALKHSVASIKTASH
jgi:hypothetical protein